VFYKYTIEMDLIQNLRFFLEEVWFTLSGSVNSQNNRYWKETINSEHYIQLILTSLFRELTEEEKCTDNATAHTKISQ
jgi:hypothetical protein